MSDSQVTTLDDAPSVASPTKVKSAAPVAKTPAPSTDAKASSMFTVTIHATGSEVEGDVVEVQPNGRLYRMPRGVPCTVPYEVLHILENATVTQYRVNGADVIEKDVPRFSFTAVPA